MRQNATYRQILRVARISIFRDLGGVGKIVDVPLKKVYKLAYRQVRFVVNYPTTISTAERRVWRDMRTRLSRKF